MAGLFPMSVASLEPGFLRCKIPSRQSFRCGKPIEPMSRRESRPQNGKWPLEIPKDDGSKKACSYLEGVSPGEESMPNRLNRSPVAPVNSLDVGEKPVGRTAFCGLGIQQAVNSCNQVMAIHWLGYHIIGSRSDGPINIRRLV